MLGFHNLVIFIISLKVFFLKIQNVVVNKNEEAKSLRV